MWLWTKQYASYLNTKVVTNLNLVCTNESNNFQGFHWHSEIFIKLKLMCKKEWNNFYELYARIPVTLQSFDKYEISTNKIIN